MSIHEAIITGDGATGLIGRAFMVLLFYWLVQYNYDTIFLPQKNMAIHYSKEVTCQLTDKRFVIRPFFYFFKKYRPDVQVSYTMNHRLYQVWAQDLKMRFGLIRFVQEKTLENFHLSDEQSCWVNANDLTQVALERYEKPSFFILIGLPLLGLFIMLLYFLKRLLQACLLIIFLLAGKR